MRIPSVSADPAAAPHVRASADEVAALLAQAGLPEVDVLTVTGGQPAVLGRRPAPPGAPTVLLYAHHDVQPTGDRAGWDSDPFEPTERDGRLYGRGVADDKAGVAAHLAALRAHGDQLPVGVTVLVEGEEEIGSPTLAPFLAEYQDRLRADVVVFADAANWTVDVPSLTTSLRGAAPVTVEVRVLHHGVHSGLYGGPVPDALTALCRLLATLHDGQGNVAVAGLARGTADPLDLTEAQLRADAAMLDGVRLIGSGGLTERLWARPALTVIGIDAPSVAEASNTLLPVARAKVSLRVAPGDDVTRASAALASHLMSHAPWGVQVTVQQAATAAPYTARTDGPAYQAARWALAEAWGAPAVEIGGGRLDSVRHRLRRGRPRRRDPHHRRRGPGHPGARHEREPAPGHVRARVPGRGAAAPPPGREPLTVRECLVEITDFEAISFDCYGTLIDWESGLAAVLGPWARSRGLALDDEALLAAYAGHEERAEAEDPGARYPDILARSLTALGRDLGAEVTAEDARRLAGSVPDWPAFEDSPAALAALGERYKLIILSNVDRASFAGSQRRLGVDFTSVLTAQDIGSYKPSPAELRRAAGRGRTARRG